MPEGRESKGNSVEQEINPRSIAIVTTTFYKTFSGENRDTSDDDELRGELALKTLSLAKEKGYQIALVDGGSSSAFLEQLQRAGITPSSQKIAGMSESRQQGFEEASKLEGVEFICWIEPERISIIKDCLLEAVRPLRDGRADVVVPKRDSESLKTYPDYQAESEQRANKIWNAILKKQGLLPEEAEDLDVWFGPKLFKNDPELVKIFLERYEFKKRNLKLDEIVRPGMWSNSNFFPIVNALAKGYRVMSVSVPYRHPAEQTRLEQDSDEYRRKREAAFRDITTSAIHLVRLLKKDPKKTGRLRKIESPQQEP